MANLNILSKVVGYFDSQTTNPLRRAFDWMRSLQVQVNVPRTDPKEIPAGSSWLFFNGTVSTSIDGTTAWTITRSVLDSTRYRFTTSGGTAPALRTSRGLTLTGQALTVAVNPDATATLTLGGGTWGSTAAGDTVFLPGPVTGDAATVFSVLNQGFWVVLAVISATVIQVSRPTDTDFSGTAETQTLASNAQVQSWSATGIQTGQSVDISAGFATTNLRTHGIVAVTPSWFEVVSTVALPLEVAKTPGVSGMVFYSSARRFLRVESDQDVAVQLNGDTGASVRLSPIQPASGDWAGWFEKWGPTWSLTVVNRSAQVANVTVHSAE